MTMLVNPFFFGASVSAGYLDDFSPAPRVAYSLRKVISTATVAIRVRRSSDNAEQDIGFAGDALDTAALAAFVGSNSAFVTTFYDQTATGINLVQATAASQPRIVNAGAFDGAAIFDGTNDWMSAASVPFGTAYAAAYMKAAMPNQSALAIMLESSSNYNNGSGRFIWYMENNLHALGTRAAVSYRRDYSISSATSLRVITNRYQMATSDASIAQQRFRVDGVDISSVASVGTPATPSVNFTTQTLYLGCRAGSAFFAPVQIHTLAVYAADTDAIVSSIEAVVGV
ncbi:arabinofuranosidase catalytic domain-containing protein [Pseudomonas sp. UBA7530]|uniref:arabinofuranosidase catalytic domain-containing protein n=1 Tax=Pseudomonas sp. UBA7530 TaxID=1947341 RepID=UPI0025DAA607|nr:arabinofuranosidase catalytic domain-containing protein [Pseudomonas sp. UBA7530]